MKLVFGVVGMTISTIVGIGMSADVPDGAANNGSMSKISDMAGAIVSKFSGSGSGGIDAAAQALIANHEEAGAKRVHVLGLGIREKLSDDPFVQAGEKTVAVAGNRLARNLEGKLNLPKKSCVYLYASDTIECYGHGAVTQAAAGQTSSMKPKRIASQNGSQRINVGSGCGAGKFCKVGN